jgi:beta-carotene 3-hydroxylase
MIYFLNAGIILLSFIIMEGVAWSLHKFVMHGFLWSLHKDHHIPHNKKFEKNDFFALIFFIPSWLLMMFGILAGCDFRLYVGIGITLYGICYALIHEGLIHKRIKVFTTTQNVYLTGLRNGHLAHHHKEKNANYKKEDDQCYGMLWVPFKFFVEAKKSKS